MLILILNRSITSKLHIQNNIYIKVTKMQLFLAYLIFDC